MSIRFDDQVAIVTGAGGGLGRTHALALAARGAKVVVNDLGGDVTGAGGDPGAAQKVVAEIEAAGGTALADGADVTKTDQVSAMVEKAMNAWGRVDILVNNAGVLRDRSFAKMTMDDFAFVLNVHLQGSANCTSAVWDIMRQQAYGRIVMTTSSSGLYGNFGQSNYGAAKMGLIGLMNTLVLEGGKYNIRVNALAPVAATRMTEDLMPQAALDLVRPEDVSTGLVTLCDRDAPNRTILCAGAGGFARTVIQESEGIFLEESARSPEAVRAALDTINDMAGAKEYQHGGEQTMKFLTKAAKAAGVQIS
ncbi:SDR family NAD(P)-dependent oxidoreductase [Yunchengibacter salinarum]|uniref:SDR family NAD(P)-dependent oxidoreductase n=1 Tax=Yunchengibacter salinarum TaxID=3133399 RepID=UPI0035B5DD21